MTQRFTVEVDIEAKDRTGSALTGVKRGFNEAFSEVITGAMRRAGEMALNFAQQLPAMAVDLTKLGISAQATERRFTQFAGGAERATMFLEAFQEGTGNTVDKMSAMQSAAKLLQMGLVDSGDEMSTVAAIATKLGDQTTDAGSRIADFAALLANQSIPRLDNFGISSGRVRQRIDELIKSGQALNREQAFKMAVMEEGAKALETLGDTSDTAASKIAVLTAAVQDAKLGFAEMAVSAIEGMGSVEELADRIRALPDTFAQASYLGQLFTATLQGNVIEVRNILNAMRDHARANHDWTSSAEDVRWNLAQQEADARMLERAMEDVGTATDKSAASFQAEARAGDFASVSIKRMAAAAEETRKAQDAIAQSTIKAADTLSSAAMQYTSYEDQMADAAQNLADKKEQIEQKHQEKLTDLARKGQAWRKSVDEEGLSIELRIAQGRLADLLKRQDEYNADTTDLERAQTERSIRNLEEEIREKTSLLEQAHDGYITMKGQNVDALIAEENRQYEEELANLEEARIQQEETQKESLGRMVLAHFNAWAEMNLATDGFTKEEAAFITQMRNDISLEYGLITESAVSAMAQQEEKWEATMAQMRGDAKSFFDYFMKKFNELPSEKVIRIRHELATPTPAEEGRGGGELLQRGSMFARGGMTMVGERGPELTFIPRGAAVYPTDMSRHITNNYNLSVNSRATSMGVQNEFFMMQGMAG